VNNIFSAYDARAELDALFPDIEAALEGADEGAPSVGGAAWIVSGRLIEQIEASRSDRFDTRFLVHLCREINSSFAHGNSVATPLRMRAMLNYVPPAFGKETFAQVSASAGRSLRQSFEHLENGLRKITDFHTHRPMGAAEFWPSAAQVEPFKPAVRTPTATRCRSPRKRVGIPQDRGPSAAARKGPPQSFAVVQCPGSRQAGLACQTCAPWRSPVELKEDRSGSVGICDWDEARLR